MSPKETTKSTFEKPFSDRWVLKHVRESPIRVALTQLKVWAPDSSKKIDEALVQELRKMPEERPYRHYTNSPRSKESSKERTQIPSTYQPQ